MDSAKRPRSKSTAAPAVQSPARHASLGSSLGAATESSKTTVNRPATARASVGTVPAASSAGQYGRPNPARPRPASMSVPGPGAAAKPASGLTAPVSSQESAAHSQGIEALEIKATLVTVVGYLKKHALATRDTVSWKSVGEIESGTMIDLSTNPDLEAKFQAYPHVEFDRSNNTYSYRPEYQINSKDELRSFVLSADRPVEASELKALCVPEVFSELASYAKERIIFIADGKNGIPNMIFANKLWPSDVDYEMPQVFKNEYFKLKVPNDTDLQRELSQAGIVSGESVDAMRLRNVRKDRLKAKERKRKIKITNLHLAGTDMDISAYINGQTNALESEVDKNMSRQSSKDSSDRGRQSSSSSSLNR